MVYLVCVVCGTQSVLCATRRTVVVCFGGREGNAARFQFQDDDTQRLSSLVCLLPRRIYQLGALDDVRCASLDFVRRALDSVPVEVAKYAASLAVQRPLAPYADVIVIGGDHMWERRQIGAVDVGPNQPTEVLPFIIANAAGKQPPPTPPAHLIIPR